MIEIINIHAWQPEFPGAPNDWRLKLGQILVEVQLSDGTIGLGVGGGGLAGIHVIQTVLVECLIGYSFENPEQAHQAMTSHTSFYGRKGIVPMAISGVDLAIWDAFAKMKQTSVYELLTDAAPPKTLPMYQTVFDDREAEQAVDSGKLAVKLHVERFGDRPKPALIEDLIAATRDRLGPGKSIMLDAFGRWDIDTTLAVAEAIEPYGIDWIEEPVGPDALDDYSYLTEHCPIPIAGGEHEYLKEGFEDLASRKAVRVFQPDINWCGGLTSLIHIYEIAKASGIRVVPHRGSEPYSLPAIAALDTQPLAESARSWFNCLEGIPTPTQEGVEFTLSPGFGVSLKQMD